MEIVDQESIRENNEKFWLEMTKKGTLQYCQEMLKLSPEFQGRKKPDTPYDEHLKKLDTEIHNYMDLVVKCTHDNTKNNLLPTDSPFPKDLHAFLHEYTQPGKFQPNHLTCKLAALRDEINTLVYEFLIEYDIFECDVEIYFGVKAVSDSWTTTPQFQDIVIRNWESVKDAGRYKRQLHRFKMTNNGNDGTFWPFWWRMGMDCKEELSDAVEIIRKFYTDYKKTLLLADIFPPKFDKIKEEVENSLRATEDYENLLECIKNDFSSEVVDLFETLIEHCVNVGFIRRNRSDEFSYISLIASKRIVCIMKVFFYTMTWEFCKDKPSGFTPIKHLSKVFLDKHGRTIGSKTWQATENNALTAWDEAASLLRQWFPEIKIKGERRPKK